MSCDCPYNMSVQSSSETELRRSTGEENTDEPVFIKMKCNRGWIGNMAVKMTGMANPPPSKYKPVVEVQSTLDDYLTTGNTISVASRDWSLRQARRHNSLFAVDKQYAVEQSTNKGHWSVIEDVCLILIIEAYCREEFNSNQRGGEWQPGHVLFRTVFPHLGEPLCRRNSYDSLRERWRKHVAEYPYWEKLLSVSRWFKSKEVKHFVATTTDVDIQTQLAMAREGLEDWHRQGCSRDCMPKLRSAIPVWLMPLPQCKSPIRSSTVLANDQSDHKSQQSGNQTPGSFY